MASTEELQKLCYDERGATRPKADCRATLINHLILEEMMDIDEAEDLADKTLKQLDLWKEPEAPEKPTA